jgi:hypothetical protein
MTTGRVRLIQPVGFAFTILERLLARVLCRRSFLYDKAAAASPEITGS